MNQIPKSLFFARHACRPLLKRLEDLFGEMESAYEAVAERYGFRCSGCEDNCCLTRFYHHTLLEVLYLAEGLERLSPAERRTLMVQAASVEDQMVEADRCAMNVRRMCPLNQDGQCRLYNHRPMICRLHGIPHELHRPGGDVSRHPGCDAFFDQCRKGGITEYIRFDRTPFYRAMAMLEKELRRETGYAEKIKLTIAQMLIVITESDHEID